MKKKVYISSDFWKALEKATGKKSLPPSVSTPSNPEIAAFLSDYEIFCNESLEFEKKFDRSL